MFNLKFHTNSYTYHFNFRLGFLLLCGFFFFLMCALGIWQLHRYHFKKQLQEIYSAHETAAPVSFEKLNKENLSQLQFQKIAVSGKFLNDKNLFLQNQFHGNEVGFDVLTPLQMPGEKKLLLIDRGWVSNNGNPNAAPSVKPINDEQHIVGNIKLQNHFQFILGDNILRPEIKPVLIQKINMRDISGVTREEFFPFYVQLSPESKNGFVREWIVTTVGPERHMGYAIQWFLMAIVLVIAYVATVVRREKL